MYMCFSVWVSGRNSLTEHDIDYRLSENEILDKYSCLSKHTLRMMLSFSRAKDNTYSSLINMFSRLCRVSFDRNTPWVLPSSYTNVRIYMYIYGTKDYLSNYMSIYILR